MTYVSGRPRTLAPRPRAQSPTSRGESRRIPRFPGVTLELDASGQILEAWQGIVGPTLGSDPDVLCALGVDENAPDAMRVQMMLASAIGAPLDAWSVLAADAPSTLQRKDGQKLLVTWSPIAECGMIGRVAMFALPAPAEAREVPEDPVETNRICVDALALLDECTASLQYFETDRGARSAVHRMFRAMHTIKGSTRGTRLQTIGSLAHDAEELIQALRDVEQAPSALLAELAESLRRLRAAIVEARPRGEIDDTMTELMRECRPVLVDLQLSIVRLSQGDHTAASAASRALERIHAASERVNMQALRSQCTAAANAVEILACGGDIEASLLDEIELVDRQIELYAAVHREASALEAGPSQLVTMRSWIDTPENRGGSLPAVHEAVSQIGMTSLVDALSSEEPLARRCAIALLLDAPAMFEPGRPHDDAAVYFERTQRDLMHALDELACRIPGGELATLRAIVQRLAWVPLTPIARRLARMVKTLAQDLEKTVEAKLDLSNLQVAPAIARVVGEILLHAVRNSLDHGLELPADRVAAGKPAAGTIEVAAYASGERLLVTVRDDGRGIAIERIRQVAVERGLLSPDAAAAAGTPELLDLLFHPGFSTARSVTSVSGRGIGMDVIRSLAEEQGGTVTLSSTWGRGTELTIDLPLAPPAGPAAHATSNGAGR